MKRWGVLVQAGGLWIGAHYSSFNRRWCINLVPCVTLWITLSGGTPPHRRRDKVAPVAEAADGLMDPAKEHAS